jgi:hypothetical protein
MTTRYRKSGALCGLKRFSRKVPAPDKDQQPALERPCQGFAQAENRHPLFGIMRFGWSVIFSENRHPLFGIMLFGWSMIFSENRYPLFGIML